MSTAERFWNIMLAVASIACACAIILDPVKWYPLVIVLLGIQFIGEGVSRLWFYFTMARHMVGGKSVLYGAIFYLDFALFAASLSSVSSFYVRIYLAISHAFAGVVDILRALEKKGQLSTSWKGQAAMGLIHLVIAIALLFFVNDLKSVMYIYAIGLFIEAINRLGSAFRNTDVIVFQ